MSKSLPEGDNVQAVVYPKYETKGELAQCAEAFLEWLKERVVELRKECSEKPWPPGDRDVGVVLVSHSMGFVLWFYSCVFCPTRLSHIKILSVILS